MLPTRIDRDYSAHARPKALPDFESRSRPRPQAKTKGSTVSDWVDSADDRSAERAATNRAIFREVSERVPLNESFELVDAEVAELVCECENNTCSARVSMSSEEYESIRRDGVRFIVAPSEEHVWAEIERVSEQNDRYWIVERFGAAAALSGDADPGSEQAPRPPLPLRT
jgi:hypothetical protein